MRIPILILILAAANLQAQDTLFIHFNTGSYALDQESIDNINLFIDSRDVNTRFNVSGHTDDVGDVNSNLALSYKREMAVYRIMVRAGLDTLTITHEHHGELQPLNPNANSEFRKTNRRVELIRYEVSPPIVISDGLADSADDNSSSASGGELTLIQKNGIRITYYPGVLPRSVEEDIRSGIDAFELIENPSQMQDNNMLTITTDGVGLSSLSVFCSPTIVPCDLDTPIVVSIPINNPMNCPLENIIFLQTEVQEGKKVWKELNQEIFPEVIGGQQYINVTLPNLCECFNFDYKIELPCFSSETVQVKFPKADSVYFEVIINSFNSVLPAEQVDETTVNVAIAAGQPELTFIDAYFKLRSKEYRLKRIPLTTIPYSTKKQAYVLTKRFIKNYR
jgi:hypothetical protein